MAMKTTMLHLVLPLLTTLALSCDGHYAPQPTPNDISKTQVFDETVVQDMTLHFDGPDWSRFLSNWQNGRKEYVKCRFEFEGAVFDKAGCRPKGNENDWKLERKAQFIINFQHFDKDGRFAGLRRINLEANPDHVAPVRDRLAMWMMRRAGLAASRVNSVKLFINGAYYGLYQNVEAVDREFLEDHFDDPSGNLYESGTILQSGDGRSAEADTLVDLVEREPIAVDHTAFYTALQQILDVDQAIDLMSAEMVLPTWDNFANGSWNFYYYAEPNRPMTVIPWDLDDCLSFRSPTDADPYTYAGHAIQISSLRKLIDQNPAWNLAFNNRLKEYADTVFLDLIEQTTHVCAQVRDAFSADPTPYGTIDEFNADCADIISRIEERRRYLDTYL